MSVFELSEDDKDVLCHTLCSGGVRGGAELVSDLLSAGISSRDLYLRVLSPVSERFDALWNQDRVTFLEVRTAMFRLEAILREVAIPEPTLITRTTRQALFASVPGEEHTAGLRMAADIQRSKGWDIHLVTRSTNTQLLSHAERTPSTILGLSIGSQRSMHRLYTLVRTLRVSRPEMKILVSGSLVAANVHPIQLLGVDAIATNLDEAEVKLEEWAEEAVSA